MAPFDTIFHLVQYNHVPPARAPAVLFVIVRLDQWHVA